MTRERKKLTRSVEKQITEDWHREFPGMGVYKPRHLLRRVGPLLLGICLDRDSSADKYKPKHHVHFLGRSSSGVALQLASQLRSARSGGPDYVTVRSHAESYTDAAGRMRSQAVLPVEGPLTFSQVSDAYAKQLKAYASYASAHSRVKTTRDYLLLACWCERVAEAGRGLKKLLRDVPDGDAYRSVGSREQLESSILAAVENPRLVQETVEQQIEELGVRKLPVAELLCVEKKSLLRSWWSR